MGSLDLKRIMGVRRYWKISQSIRKKKQNYILDTNCFFWNLLFFISSFLGNQTLMMSSSVKALLEKNEYGGKLIFFGFFFACFQ